MSNEDTLKAAFVAGLGIDQNSDFDSLTYRGIDEWDSVAHMQLISEIEDAFDVMLETEDVLGLSSYSAAKEILKKYEVEA